MAVSGDDRGESVSAERWRQVDTILKKALEREPSDRIPFLDDACESDPSLRKEVEALIAAYEQAGSFLEAPLLDRASGATRPQTLGHYELKSLLGSGGMGDVYLAEDKRLGRRVAIKLLPAEFTADAESVRRFAQEARAASALNHPNIITIYEIDDLENAHYIVTEYVEGETLRQRMDAGPLTLPEAVDLAIQIAAALEAAHHAGIIHRDIKPENVMVRPDGYIKVLDFGLAKLVEPPTAGLDAARSIEAGVNTETGLVMGTPRCMSPEQARGEKADARTDIFSLGIVLYEMVTGRAPFAGATRNDVIAAILRDEPPSLSGQTPTVPPYLGKIVEKALRKSREERYQTAKGLLDDLNHLKQELAAAESASDALIGQSLKAKPKFNRWTTFAVVLLLVIAWVAFGPSGWIGRKKSQTQVPNPKVVFFTSFPGDESEPAFSPEGDRIAFVWRPQDGNADIYVKQLGGEGLLRLTDDPADDTGPAWSSDGRHIAFLRRSSARSAIYLVPPLGGGERKLADVFNDPGLMDGAWPHNQNPNWSPDGESLAIVDKGSPQEPFGIFLITRETGEKRRLTAPPPASYGDTSPAFSPDGKLLAFVRVPGSGAADVYVTPAAGGEPRRLTFSNQLIGRVTWTPDGRAIVFDMGAVVGMGGLWRVSASGGMPERLVAAGQSVLEPAISPRGGRLAYTQSLRDLNIWRLELSSPNGQSILPKEFISSTQTEQWAEFSPDGKRILFLSTRSGSYEVWVCGAEGEHPVQLTDLNTHTGTPHWVADGRNIVFDSRREGNADVYMISAEGGKPRRLTTDAAEDITPSSSKDGRWIYFGSTRSGSLQIWKMPAEGGSAVQVTKQGGFEGFESPDGQFFYYAKGRGISGIWRVPVAGGQETPVLERHQAGLRRAWTVVTGGIYFATAETPSQPMIEFFNFATGNLTPIITTDKPFSAGLSISPDGRWLIYTQVDRTGRDIMLMENFR
jgi:Tol biopolymer transport system component